MFLNGGYMKTVLRHNVITRIEHWGIALSGLMLYATHEMQDKSLHIYIGVAFSLFLAMHISWRVFTGFDALMKKGDISEGLHIIKSFFVKNTKIAPQGKFLPEQRVVYTGCGILCILVAVSGLANILYYYYPVLRDSFAIKALWYTHHITAALFVIFFIVHIFFLILPANRYLISSMLTGRLSMQKAEEKHPEWNYEK